MASTLTRLLIHITFSTKGREPMIDPGIENDLYSYCGGICRGVNSALLSMGGTVDHVHMLVTLGKTTALADLMLNVKRDSSNWMKNHSPGFAWQDGYFAFSIGESGVEGLRAYLAKQKEHHARVDFKDEVREILRKYGMEWNERFVWE